VLNTEKQPQKPITPAAYRYRYKSAAHAHSKTGGKGGKGGKGGMGGILIGM